MAADERVADVRVALICTVCGKIEMGRPGQKHRGLEGHPVGGAPMRRATAGDVAAVQAEWAKRAASDRMQAVKPG
jgi:hypothetical protein